MLRILLASFHLIALGLGLGAVLTRGSLLKGKVTDDALKLVLRYDAVWGIAALLWLSTGLWRWLASVEKSASYYSSNHIFLTKMALFLSIVVIEFAAAKRISAWRKGLRAGHSAETLVGAEDARRVARLSHIEAGVVVVMVILAAAMARGVG